MTHPPRHQIYTERNDVGHADALSSLRLSSPHLRALRIGSFIGYILKCVPDKNENHGPSGTITTGNP